MAIIKGTSEVASFDGGHIEKVTKHLV